MKTITIKNIVVGEGIPKVCIPIMGTTVDEIIKEVKAIKTKQVDMVEWRMDAFEGVDQLTEVMDVLFMIRKLLLNTPLLATFRTTNEGGLKAYSKTQYEDLLKAVIASKAVDIVDVELFYSEDKDVRKMLMYAHEMGVYVLLSNHEFHKTPSHEEIVQRLCKMQDIGGDVVKIAVMPSNQEDVLTLLKATNTMREQYAKCPIVTISMSSLGLLSRLAGELYGSAITFGTVTSKSAPGQLYVDDLQTMMKLIHQNL